MADTDVVHCPICHTEYPHDMSICLNDGALLVAGPAEPEPEPVEDDAASDGEEVARGRIEVVRLEPPSPGGEGEGSAPADLFEQEEHPDRLRLAVMAKEDAPDLVSALELEGIGARLGAESDGGIEVIVHDTHLAEAQAVLVEFTGDPSLVDDLPLDPSGGDGVDRGDLLRIFEGATDTAEAGAERIRDAGIDVRMELSRTDGGAAHGSLWVAPADLDQARDELGIAR